MGSTATISGAGGFLSTLRVAGATSLESNVVIGGTATITGNTGFLGTVRVSGAVSLEDAVVVGGTATITGNSGFLGTLRVAAAVSLENNVVIGGTATITGNSGFLGTVRVSGNTSVGGTFALAKSAAASVHTTAINGVASVSLNFGGAQNFLTTVTAAHTMARPTNARVGQTGSIFFVQSGGSGTLSWNACWKFPAGSDPTFSTSGGAVDRLDYIVASISSDDTGENIQAILSQEYS